MKLHGVYWLNFLLSSLYTKLWDLKFSIFKEFEHPCVRDMDFLLFLSLQELEDMTTLLLTIKHFEESKTSRIDKSIKQEHHNRLKANMLESCPSPIIQEHVAGCCSRHVEVTSWRSGGWTAKVKMLWTSSIEYRRVDEPPSQVAGKPAWFLPLAASTKYVFLFITLTDANNEIWGGDRGVY